MKSNTFSVRYTLPILALSLMLNIFPAHAASPRLLLENNDCDPESVAVLLHWTERAPAAKREMVTGLRLAPLDGGATFDLYFDSDGVLMGGDRLAELGIPARDWDAPPVSVDGYRTAGNLKALLRPRPEPGTVVYKLAVPRLVVPPVDIQKALAEDEAGTSTPEKGVLRIGVFADLAEPVVVNGTGANASKWLKTGDENRIWAIELFSEGAAGLRVHFSRFAFPAEARVLIYDAGDPGEVYGPFAPADDFWAPACFSESVVVECTVPAGLADPDIDIAIDRLAHLYKTPPVLKQAPDDCNIELACDSEYEAWESISHGVAGIGTIGVTGVLWCTGSLLADMDDATQIPYFLTANHCVDGAEEAGPVEVYWFYQTTECGAEPPDPAELPRTAGAEFLAGASGESGTDFTLLQLSSDAPAGVSYLGYNTGTQSLGTQVTCIHHPRGADKHISYGTLTNYGSPSIGGERQVPAETFHEVLWDLATTEGGSSGAPLFLNSENPQIIGQLYGGKASCTRSEEPDYYGRFDVTWPLIRGWVGDGSLYTLTIHIDGGGGVSINGEVFYQETIKRTFSEKARITLMAEGDDGWRFRDWEGDLNSEENPVEVVMDRDKEITVYFRKGLFGCSAGDGKAGTAGGNLLLVLLIGLLLAGNTFLRRAV
jgi:hypothetical protein